MIHRVFVWMRFIRNMCVMNLLDKRRAYDALQNMVAPVPFVSRNSSFGGRSKKCAGTAIAIHRCRAECIDIKAIRHAAIWLYLQYLPPQLFYILDKLLLLAFGVALGAVHNHHVLLIAARLLDGIPQEKKTQSQEFLGVTCSDIVFKNGYPDMDTKLGVLYPDLFPKGYATWQTVYVTGLDNTWGSVMDNGLKLDFYGTVKNDNIIVCGLNLAYYYGVSADKSVGRLLSDMMDITSAQLPERTNIELKVEHDVNGITITSDYDNVNTSLSYHDIFVSDEWLGKKNNLTFQFCCHFQSIAF